MVSPTIESYYFHEISFTIVWTDPQFTTVVCGQVKSGEEVYGHKYEYESGVSIVEELGHVFVD